MFSPINNLLFQSKKSQYSKFSKTNNIFIVSITLIGLVGVLQASVVFTEISAWAGTWRDNFDDGDFNGWEMSKLFWANGAIVPDEGNWRVEDGAVIGGDENPAVIYNLLSSKGWSWSDYTAEVSVKLSKPIPGILYAKVVVFL